MNSNVTISFLIPVCILIGIAIDVIHFEIVTRPMHGPFIVSACMTNIKFIPKSIRFPTFWSLFGQNDEQDVDLEEKPGNEETREKSLWTTSDWITKHNYPLDVPNLTTADGYFLQLHRLPQPGHTPILLVHGLLTSSISWVVMGPNSSLAFLLSNKEYDVWLANFRGTPYSRKHEHFNTSSNQYWSFSFHEMGIYDLAAIIDYVRNETSFHQIILITHSQAFITVLTLCSMKREYNERIQLIQALAPILELKNKTKFNSQDMKKIVKFLKEQSKQKTYEVFPLDITKQSCLNSNVQKRKNCHSWMKKITGKQQYSKTLDPIIYGQLLQGGSFKELNHLVQLWQSGDFATYDYGLEGNLEMYNSVNPILYNLSHVTAPMILHYGQTDALGTTSGINRIYSKGSLPSILGVYRVAADVFNHLDFVCSSSVKTLVNEKLINLMEKYLSGQLEYVIE